MPLGDRRGRLGAIGDRHVQRLVGGFEIFLHQERRRVIGRAGIVKAVSRSILGQLFFQVDVDAQQIAHRILVLDSIEPAEGPLDS